MSRRMDVAQPHAAHAGTPSLESVGPAEAWGRDSMVTAALLLVVTAWAWFHTLRGGAMTHGAMADGGMADGGMMHGAMADGAMHGSPHAAMMDGGAAVATSATAGALLLFVTGWVIMMAAMMLPAVLPLVMLHRRAARRRHRGSVAAAMTVLLLATYLAVWAVAGLPVYGYSVLVDHRSAAAGLAPALLLIGGGAYHFTALKRNCHARCSSPLAFLTREWRPGWTGTLRLGGLHGLDCLGCCAGLMAGLVALGMMNVAWMLTAAVIIFVEKTHPLGHHLARPVGVAMAAGGIVLLGRVIG
jgi:predicted metal-binding membrane protein